MFKAASLKLGLDYAVMHNMSNAAAAQEQLQSLKVDLADAHGDEEVNAVSETKTNSARAGRRSNRGRKEIEGISLDRAEHYSSLSKKELENLLKHGAYDIFREEKDGTTTEETNKYYEADIDQILQVSLRYFYHRVNFLLYFSALL